MFALQPRPLDEGLPAPTPLMEPVDEMVSVRVDMETAPEIVTAPVMTRVSYEYEPAAMGPASSVAVTPWRTRPRVRMEKNPGLH